MKIIIDTNLWISFLIGKRLSVLKALLTHSNLSFFVCDEILNEIQNISSKQKIRKYVGIDDIIDTLEIINNFCKYTVITKKAISPVRDANDLYLLSLADTIQADFILTGDKDLLTLQFHNQTKIVTYNEFVEKHL
jgi:putative PIN family toxin of toxin-antitoxin system